MITRSICVSETTYNRFIFKLYEYRIYNMVCYLFLSSVMMKYQVTELKERYCLLRCFFLVFLSCIVFWKSIVSFLLIDSNTFYRYCASYFLQIVSVLTGHILIHLTILSTLRKAWLLTLLNFLLHYSLFFFFLSFVLGCIASFSTFLLLFRCCFRREATILSTFSRIGCNWQYINCILLPSPIV